MSVPLVELGDICTTTQGVQITKANTSNELYDGGYRYLYIADFISDKKLSFVDDKFDAKKVTEHDLVMANTGSPGRVFKGKEGILSNNLFRITFDEKIVNRDYLYLILSSPVFQGHLQQQMKGGIQKHLGHKTISRQTIPLPPLGDQVKIAEVLDAADSLKQKDQQLVEHYDRLSQSLFLDMFGEPSKNPYNFKLKSFSSIVKNCNSLRVPIKQADRAEMQGSYPYYGATGIVDHINDFKLDGQYLLIAEDGKNLVNRKKPLAWCVNGQFWVNNHAHVVEFKGVCNLVYLEYLLSNMDISSYVTGIDQFKMNKSNLNRIPIMLPELEKQEQFEKYIVSIQAQKKLAQQGLKKSNDLFNSLLQRAFKGELTDS